MLKGFICRASLIAQISFTAFCQTPNVQKWVAPDYPALAQYLNCSGHIEVFLTVKPDGNVERAHADAFGANNQQLHLRRLFKASEDAAMKWTFSKSSTNHLIKLNFAYQLFPPDTPDNRLVPEQITEHSILIKAKAPIIPNSEIQ